MQQSSKALRPRTFAQVVGQANVLSRLTKLHARDRFPSGLLFHGPSGVGKTTVARIVANSLQCSHREFGKPCRACRRKYKLFPIYELNASKETGKDAVEQFVSGSQYDPFDETHTKVYILDEAHKFSDSAQNLLLKYFEADDSDVIWIICTTKPDAIIETLRQRCRSFKFTGLGLSEVKTLVSRLLTKNDSELGPEPLVDELYENKITSGRLIANAVDNYISGLSPEDAVSVDIEVNVESKPLCRAVVKGDWAVAASILNKSNKSEVRLLKASVTNYLMSILLGDSDISDRTTAVAKALGILSSLHAFDTSGQWAGFAAAMYNLCKIFQGRGL